MADIIKFELRGIKIRAIGDGDTEMLCLTDMHKAAGADPSKHFVNSFACFERSHSATCVSQKTWMWEFPISYDASMVTRGPAQASFNSTPRPRCQVDGYHRFRERFSWTAVRSPWLMIWER